MRLHSVKTFATLGFCVALPIALAGCQSTCTGDPRFDNYWCARSNLHGGVYAQQTDQLRRTAAERQSEAATLKRQLQTRQSRLTSARARNASPSEVHQLEAEITSLRQQINYLSR